MLDSEPRVRAGRAVRDLGHALVGHVADDALLDELSEQLERIGALLSVGERRSRVPDTSDVDRGDGDAQPGDEMTSPHDDRPVSGRASPWGLDPVIHRIGDEVEAVLTLRSAHEGAPGRSHGGVVAALFDDIYGYVLSMQRTPGFTGELTIRYEGATPIGVPLRCRVRLASKEGRKLFMTGELTTPDGSVCVRSKATFITVERSTAWGEGV